MLMCTPLVIAWVPYHKLARKLGWVSLHCKSVFLETSLDPGTSIRWKITTLIGEFRVISDDELQTFPPPSFFGDQEYLKRDAYLSDQAHGEHPNPGISGVKVQTPAALDDHPVGEYFAAWTMDLCSKDPQNGSIFVHPGWWELTDFLRIHPVKFG